MVSTKLATSFIKIVFYVSNFNSLQQARNRKSQPQETAQGRNKSSSSSHSNNRGHNSSSSSNSKENGHTNNTGNENNVNSGIKFISMSSWYVAVGVASIAIVSYFVYFGYLETRVNTPFDEKKIVQRSGLNDPEKYWGTYRPQTYFGLKTRDPHSLVMGLMWYFPSKLKQNGDGIRHWCKLDDNLRKYGWLQHDGKNFGIQEIHDDNYIIETSFIKFYTGKYGGEWTARVQVKPRNPNRTEPMSLIWYSALDEKTDGNVKPTYNKVYGIEGDTKGLGSFKLSLHNTTGKSKKKQDVCSAFIINTFKYF